MNIWTKNGRGVLMQDATTLWRNMAEIIEIKKMQKLTFDFP